MTSMHHSSRGNASRRQRGASPGFTLIELLVVIGIIGILIGVTLAVGYVVMQGGKQRLTKDTLLALDSALQQFIAEKGDNPDPLFVDPSDPNKRFPIADARDMDNTSNASGGGLMGNQMINSVGFFYEQGRKVPSVNAILTKLPAKVVRLYDADNTGQYQPELTTVFDGWGQPIRYVHPVFQGVVTGDIASPTPTLTAPRDVAQIIGTLSPTPPSVIVPTLSIAKIRRNNQPINDPAGTAQEMADSDGGMCVGNRPYFYSAGPDGKVGVKKDASGKVIEDYNKDNVYTTPPNFTDRLQ